MGKILIIDDEYHVRELLYDSIVKFTDNQVDLASSGEEGLEMIKNKKYNLVFLDFKLPNMNGEETIKKAKEYDKELPVVIMSGIASYKDKQNCLKAGAVEFISKPFTLNKMVSSINSYARS